MSKWTGEVFELLITKGRKRFRFRYRPDSEDLSAFVERFEKFLSPTWEAELTEIVATKDSERLKMTRNGSEVPWSEVFRNETLRLAQYQHEINQTPIVKRLIERVRAEGEERRKSASDRGKHRKRREIIFQAIVDRLRKNPPATNNKVWDSFPEGREEAETIRDNICNSVFRDGEDLCQEYSGGKKPKIQCIGRSKFDDYMTEAREGLGISTRQKKRQKKDQ